MFGSGFQFQFPKENSGILLGQTFPPPPQLDLEFD